MYILHIYMKKKYATISHAQWRHTFSRSSSFNIKRLAIAIVAAVTLACWMKNKWKIFAPMVPLLNVFFFALFESIANQINEQTNDSLSTQFIRLSCRLLSVISFLRRLFRLFRLLPTSCRGVFCTHFGSKLFYCFQLFIKEYEFNF